MDLASHLNGLADDLTRLWEEVDRTLTHFAEEPDLRAKLARANRRLVQVRKDAHDMKLAVARIIGRFANDGDMPEGTDVADMPLAERLARVEQRVEALERRSVTIVSFGDQPVTGDAPIAGGPGHDYLRHQREQP